MLRQVIIGLTRFLVGGRAYWLGSKPSNRQRIYFANHTSNLDTVVLWASLPPELRRTTHPCGGQGLLGRRPVAAAPGTRGAGAVLIERGGGAAALDPVRAVLKEGESLIIFPEGQRGPGPLPLPFKTGLYHLARAHPQVELVPVWLDNVGRALPKGVVVPIPVSATAIFGSPIAPLPEEEKEQFLARARGALLELGRRLHPELADA
jgi:1-acyl-sn-glycerol-3-phosphate acyltransferase